MEIGSQRIVHVNVTTNHTLRWVKQQIRIATADDTPRLLVRDNDGILGQFRGPITGREMTRSYCCQFDYWLNEVMNFEGIPIPYGAPNASPHVQRFMRTLRHETLDHFIFLGVGHVRRVVNDYVRARVSSQ